MAKKVDVTFKNPIDESFIDHLELWRKTGVGGTYAQIGSDIPFVTGTADYTYEDLTASVDDAVYYYEARAYNDNGGEVEGTDYNALEANITISPAASTILWEYDFAGTTPNTSFVTVTNPTTTKVVHSQNGESIWTLGTAPTSSTVGADNVTGVTGFDISTPKFFVFNLQVDNQNTSTWFAGLMKGGAPQTDFTDRVIFGVGTTAGDVRVTTRINNVDVLSEVVTLDVSTYKTVVVEMDATNTKFWWWNGSAYVQLGTTTAHGESGLFYPFSSFRSVTGVGTTGEVFKTDQWYVCDTMPTTQIPV